MSFGERIRSSTSHARPRRCGERSRSRERKRQLALFCCRLQVKIACGPKRFNALFAVNYKRSQMEQSCLASSCWSIFFFSFPTSSSLLSFAPPSVLSIPLAQPRLSLFFARFFFFFRAFSRTNGRRPLQRVTAARHGHLSGPVPRTATYTGLEGRTRPPTPTHWARAGGCLASLSGLAESHPVAGVQKTKACEPAQLRTPSPRRPRYRAFTFVHFSESLFLSLPFLTFLRSCTL